jgi:two-component system chemotaxis response regulator CheY
VSQHRILVVDDEEPVRSLMTNVFESAGYTVECAKGGREALQKVAGPRPDLMTLDLMMPEGSGWDVIEGLRAQANPPYVVLVSGATDAVQGRGALPPYVVGVLNKPFLPRDLLEICETVLGREKERQQMARSESVERRRVPRRDLIMDVRVAPAVGSPMLKGKLTDLSPLGAEIELPSSMNAGQTVRLALRFPGRERALLVDGQIQYCAMRHVLWACGLEFVNVPAHVQEELALLLELPAPTHIRAQ